MVTYTAKNLDEALSIRSTNNVIPYSGGTDLMVEGNEDVTYLFLHQIPEIRQIWEDEENLYFGAGCTFTQIAESALCPDLLRDAILQIAAPAIRNMGTIGGNIGNGSAKADTALIFYVTDSFIKLASVKGERILPIEDFYLGRKKLDLHDDELIVEIIMPKHGLSHYYYEKVGARDALAISRIAFAGILDIENGIIKKCATAFGAVSDTIIRRKDIDAMLLGKTLKEVESLKTEYLAAYDKAIVPIRGRVSAEYRKSVCFNLLNDFITKAF